MTIKIPDITNPKLIKFVEKRDYDKNGELNFPEWLNIWYDINDRKCLYENGFGSSAGIFAGCICDTAAALAFFDKIRAKDIKAKKGKGILMGMLCLVFCAGTTLGGYNIGKVVDKKQLGKINEFESELLKLNK